MTVFFFAIAFDTSAYNKLKTQTFSHLFLYLKEAVKAYKII